MLAQQGLAAPLVADRKRRKKRTKSSTVSAPPASLTAASGGGGSGLSSRHAHPVPSPRSASGQSAIGIGPARFKVAPGFESSLRAELADARALEHSVVASRLQLELVALRSEVATADALVARCEDALQLQAEQLSATRVQLVETERTVEDLREGKLRAEQEAIERQQQLEKQLSKQAALQAVLDQTAATMTKQGEDFRREAEKIAQHREAEAKAFGERRRLWERTVDDWLKAGFHKRIDPIVQNVNQPVYERLRELLVEEQAQREHQMKYLELTNGHELKTLREQMNRRLAESEAQHLELVQQKTDFSVALGQALSSYLKGEWAAECSSAPAWARASP